MTAQPLSPPVSFRDLAATGALTFGDGYRTKQDELGPHGFKILRVAQVAEGYVTDDFGEHVRPEFQSKIGPKLSKTGDVVLTTKGTFGRRTIISPDKAGLVYSPQVCYFRIEDSERVDGRFLYYWLASPDFLRQASGMKSQTDMADYLNLRDLGSIKVRLPPIEQQREVANTLSILDERLNLNRQNSRTLESLARTVFRSWFVDFDPVRAKMEGRPIGIPKDVAALFPDGLADSPLGLIPAGWEVVAIGDTCSRIFSGGTPSTKNPDFWEGPLPWLSSGETRSKVIVNTERTISQRAVEASSTRLARAGSTVIASAGQGWTRGQTSYLAFDSYVNQSVVVLEADLESSSDLHLFWDLERRYDQLRQLSDSHSSRGSLTTKLLAGILTIRPPSSLVRKFDAVVEPLMQRMAANLRAGKTLRALRDALLPKLLSSESRGPAEGQEVVA